VDASNIITRVDAVLGSAREQVVLAAGIGRLYQQQYNMSVSQRAHVAQFDLIYI